MKINPRDLSRFLEQASFQSSGDMYEQNYGHYLSERFPNCQRFWRVFIVPLTRRMDGYPNEFTSNIKFRQSIAPKLEDIASAHYSMFVNLIYAHQHLEIQMVSSVGDTYVHLASACDLAESVLEEWYLLLLMCRGGKSHLLQELSRDECLEIAGEWYDGNYQHFREYYLSRGKSPPIRLLSVRDNLLKEYFGNSKERKNYARHSQSIREFRNVIVHDVQVGKIADLDGTTLVPRPTAIRNYRSWRQVAAAVSDQNVIRKDFVEPYQQSKKDMETLESLMDRLWSKMLDDFEEEFYSVERAPLREMFGMEFSSDPSATISTPGKVSVSTPYEISGSGVYSGSLSDIILPKDEH